MAADRYFWGSRDKTLARLQGGAIRQVWQPKAHRWVDYDIDLAGECAEITEEQARQIAGVASFGEFAPNGSSGQEESA